MALATTTLSNAVTTSDTSIVVASATSVAAGRLIIVDQEVMRVGAGYSSGTTVPVLRGQDGTVTAAHKASANVTHGLASDFASPTAPTSVTYPAQRAVTITSYSAAGAITLPAAGSDLRCILNGTVALAMTIADPTKDMDGTVVEVVANGKAAHTITPTTPFGNGGAGYAKFTFAAGGQNSVRFMAANGIWTPLSLIAGTATNISATISA
ncbi:MAG TPA: hypothetical protein VE714_07215 [Gemmatimonadales bacterium]|nr:hypothetical protein [Gemmatimonadales bacterium]